MRVTDKVKVISEILQKELNSVYCPTCKYQGLGEKESEKRYGEWGCDVCYRRMMGWELGEEASRKLARQLIVGLED